MLTAVIPVRKGSQRVKNKNKKPFAGKTLLQIKIEILKSLKQCGKLDNIIVSSDDSEMLDFAEASGVNTLKRESYYASNQASNSEFFYNIAQCVDSKYIMYSPVTSPLISKETYYEVLTNFQNERTNYVTVSPVKHHLWMNGKPLNYDIKNSPNSQDLPDIYSINYGICIIKREDMLTYKNIVTNNPTFVVLDEIEGVDIDTELDFQFAEFLYKRINK